MSFFLGAQELINIYIYIYIRTEDHRAEIRNKEANIHMWKSVVKLPT